MVILGATDRRAPQGFAPAAIGLALTLIHLISIPVTNTSVNPARSTGPALMVALTGDNWALSQLWLFLKNPLPVSMKNNLWLALLIRNNSSPLTYKLPT
jgi:aquaporin Z